MPTINISKASAGSTTSAGDTNVAYGTIELLSVGFDEDNIRSEAVHRAHLASDVVTPLIDQSTNVSTTQAYTNTSYAHVNHGTAMTVPINRQLNEGDVVRCHANVYITDVTLDGTDTDGGMFSFKFYWDIGAGYVPIEDVAYKYSLSVRPEDIATESVYKNRRLGFSLCYIHQGTAITPTNIRVYVALTNSANSITIKQTVLNVIIQQH